MFWQQDFCTVRSSERNINKHRLCYVSVHFDKMTQSRQGRKMHRA